MRLQPLICPPARPDFDRGHREGGGEAELAIDVTMAGDGLAVVGKGARGSFVADADERPVISPGRRGAKISPRRRRQLLDHARLGTTAVSGCVDCARPIVSTPAVLRWGKNSESANLGSGSQLVYYFLRSFYQQFSFPARHRRAKYYACNCCAHNSHCWKVRNLIRPVRVIGMSTTVIGLAEETAESEENRCSEWWR